MIVLDASAAVDWLLGTSHASAVDARLAAHATVHAPHLLPVDVAQVTRRYVTIGNMSEARWDLAFADLVDLGVAYHDHEPLLPTIWSLRANLTAYDAAYVALALALEAPLVTMDRRLAAAPHGARIDVPA